MSIVTIPREIQLLIFGQLRVVELVRVSETCHHLKDVARDPSLWKKLTLTYERIKNKNEACRNHVSRCSSLLEIVISISGEEKSIRSDKIMSVVMKAKNSLTSINLSPSFAGLSNSSFEKFGEMSHLTHLAVGGGKLGPGGISALACLTKLKTLKVPGIVCGRFGAQSNDIPMASLVDLFSKLKKLEQVEIQMKDNFPSDEVVKSLVNNNPNLHHLDITQLKVQYCCPNNSFRDMDVISSRSLILIADKCPQLTHIGIGNLGCFSDTSITKLVTKCPKLKHANFKETEFSDSALAMMSRNCPDLEYLNIIGCELVTEEALMRFANPETSANLKRLCVTEYYYSYPQLLDKLKEKLPNVNVIREDEDSSDLDYPYPYLDYLYPSDDEDVDQGICSLM